MLARQRRRCGQVLEFRNECCLVLATNQPRAPKIMRRAMRHGKHLGMKEPFLYTLVDTLVREYGDAYPELRENRAFAIQVAGSEEERFSATLRQGRELLSQAIDRARPGTTLSGDDAFKLHDTFGFPKELTLELAEDSGLEVDLDRFDELMQEQRRRAKEAVKKGSVDEAVAEATARVGATEFTGYRELETPSEIVALPLGVVTVPLIATA